jgi:phosphoribosylanthranilate isomerase
MRVKICGLCRPEDARLAAESGADYGGVILSPGSPRSQTLASAEPILAAAGVLARVGVFIDSSFDDVVTAGRALDLSILQLHGSEAPSQVEALRDAGAWRVWKGLRPRTGDEFAREVARYVAAADGILVDGWSAAVAGGGGVAFDWAAVTRCRDRVPPDVEWVVAGGLTPENVAEAITMLDPDTVDVSSGVEASAGVKSAAKVRAFIAGAREAATGHRKRP